MAEQEPTITESPAARKRAAAFATVEEALDEIRRGQDGRGL